MLSLMNNIKTVHYNRSQLRAAMVDANTEVHIIPRGDGKTEGIIARKIATNSILMPRSLGMICHRDYESMLTKTLPPVIRGLAKLGYHKDYHYFIGKLAPKKYQSAGRWALPHFPIVRAEYVIHWFTGAAQLLVSFNRENSANGASGDYIIADEAKFITGKFKSRFDEELVPAMRGNREYFGKLSQYHGVTFTTDQPTNSGGKWLYDYEKQVDPLQIEVILGLQYQIAEVRKKLSEERSDRMREKLHRRIMRLNYDLNHARLDSVFYHEPEPLSNLEILGDKTYLHWKKILPDLVFRTSILNERLLEVEDGFYPLLDSDHHVVDYPSTKIEDIAHNTNFDPDALVMSDCSFDMDISPYAPLDVALDWGDHINCLVVGQEFADAYHVTNAMFVKKPERVQNLINKFCDYYKSHKKKVVNLPYDVTAYAGHGAFDSTYIEEVIKVFRKNGWQVNSVNLGQTKPYELRFRLWNDILAENDKATFKPIRFNKRNTEFLIISMKQAPVKQGLRGFEKDKKSEKDRINTPQEEATHFSEAADTLVLFKYLRKSGLSDDMDIIVL